MVGNIVGEPIELFVADQIDLRQKIYGAGYNENSLARTPEYLNYLNNRNAWIKLASGVELYDLKQYLLDKNEIAYNDAFQQNTDDVNQLTAIQGENATQIENIESQVGDSPYNKGTQRLKDLQKFSTDGYFTENDIKSLDGLNLAKKYVLFNTIQEYKNNTYVNRSGVRTGNSWSSSQNKIYGGMGSNERGLQPVPGIIGVDVDTINRGSIKKATVTLKAFNKFQFGIIEILYLRLGYTMMLEYGWDKLLRSDQNGKLIVEDVGSTIIENEWFKDKSYSQREMSDVIGDYTAKYAGNYSGFFGKVSNFSWKLNKDNTYDITINLISLGSVIESLEVSIPSAISITQKSTQQNAYQTTISKELETYAKAGKESGEQILTKYDIDDIKEDESLNDLLPISLNAGSDSITNFCMNAIINMKSYIENNGDTNYYYATSLSAKIKNRYFIRFGYFLEFIQNNIIGNVDNKNSSSPRLEIDTNVNTNLVGYIPNLIPLEPSKAIFSPILRNITLGTRDYFRNPFRRGEFETLLNIRERFAFNDRGVYYGKLMNVYLNISFIISSLESNKDSEGNLSLFNFLKALTDGINTSLGNSTKISPAVKDDNIIYFVDENPIIGYDTIRTPSPRKESTLINLFGYNTNGTSNFVKDFGFQTKISPKTMNQISIGATAGGYQNATDSVGYKWWNRGLKNRFEETYSRSSLAYSKVKTKEDEIFDNFKALVKIGDSGDGDRAYRRGSDGFFYQTFYGKFGYRYYYRNKGKLFFGKNYDDVKESNKDEENFKSEGLKADIVKFVEAQDAKFIEEQNLKNVDKDKIEFKKYSDAIKVCYPSNIFEGSGHIDFFYLDDILRGEVPFKKLEDLDIFADKNPLFGLSEEQLNGLKNTFKGYSIALADASFKKEEINSNQIGFIPVELSFTCDGLAGWKIYNKLDVNQRELPSSYPNSLKFLIRGIKDKISGNIWETSIDTICQPPTTKKLSNEKFVGGSEDIGVGIYTGPEVNKKTLIQGISLETDKTFNGLIYIDEETPKTQVVLHHTANNSSAQATINYWRGLSDNISTHFIINRDGTYDQLFDLKYWAYHLGTSNQNLNKNSIGIELESYGYLTSFREVDGEKFILQDGKNLGKRKDIEPLTFPSLDRYGNRAYELVTWANSTSEPISKITYDKNGNNYRGYANWQGYTYAQLNTLYTILLRIQKEYPNIPLGINSREDYLDMFPPEKEVSQNAINGIPGIYTHNSYRATEKSDVYPANNLISLLSGRSTPAPRFGLIGNQKYNSYGYVNDYGDTQRINFKNGALKFKSSLGEKNNSTVLFNINYFTRFETITISPPRNTLKGGDTVTVNINYNDGGDNVATAEDKIVINKADRNQSQRIDNAIKAATLKAREKILQQIEN